jgi:N-glycosylase/DNA lyase
MDAGTGIRILRQDPWEVLVSFIISQNRNISAIRRSVELLAECCGELRVDVRGQEYHAFPDPAALAALDEEDLRACSLGYRAPYVHAAARAVASGECDLGALMASPATHAQETLMRLKGVGVKVASCVRLFGLHHLDAFPIDVWIRRLLEDKYPDGFPFEAYAPYNGVYQQYLFAYYRSASAHPPTDAAVMGKDDARV